MKKEITTVKGGWKSELNYHKIWRTFSLNFSKIYQCFERLYKTLGRMFHPISKHLEVGLENPAAPPFFSPLLGVWKSNEKLFLVCDILENRFILSPQAVHGFLKVHIILSKANFVQNLRITYKYIYIFLILLLETCFTALLFS